MRKTMTLLLALVAPVAPQAIAQQPAAIGGVVTASEPGKAAIAEIEEITASVTAVDKATRTVTLKGPKGKSVDVVAGPEVRNFDQIKAGDRLVVKYIRALTLELKKTGGKVRERSDKEDMVRAEPGQKPGMAAAKQVTIIADVAGVDPNKKIISLRGPKGKVVDLQVQNPDHFKVVKKGDQVEAVYTEAVAVAIEAPAKSGGKK